MTSLSIKPEDEGGDALGKTVSELQTGVIIAGLKISGTLHKQEEYPGFSKTDNSGHFLVLHVDYPEDAEVKFSVVGGTTKDKKMGDHQLIVKVKDAASQKIKFDITKDGATSSATYDLSGLVLDGDA